MTFLEEILKYFCGIMIFWELAQALSDHRELAMMCAAERIGIPSLNAKQKQAVCAFLDGKYVFVSLPTGIGKSACFQSIPFVFDYLKSSQSSYVELWTHLLQANSDKSSFFTVSPDRFDNRSTILFQRLRMRAWIYLCGVQPFHTHTAATLKEWLSWFLARCHRSSYDQTVPLTE